MSLGARAIAIAARCIGVHEQPPGSNRGPEVDEYLRAVGLDPARGRYPWCAAFVCAMIQRAAGGWAAPLRWRSSASCKLLVARNPSLALPGPKAGCVFVHLRPDGKGHCGLVTGLRDDGWVGIEGNANAAGSRTGGEVVALSRPLSYASAFLRVA